MDGTHLGGGFADPAIDAASAFREIMEAMARPGTIRQAEGAAPPAPLSVAAGTALLTLCDTDTPVHLAGETDCEAVRAWLAFHIGAPIVPADKAMFAVGPWDALKPLDRFMIGKPDYPDRSATLIVEVAQLTNTGARLIGPGIQTTAELSLPELDAIRANHALFPLGLDFVFTAGSTLAALPRTTEVS